ncbi:MAG: translation initiation factor IF-1 [Candidatus Paceibacterota bacterium]|jgi:translation initiation factor IF-1
MSENNILSSKGEELVPGVITEALPNTLFKVKIENPEEKEILAYLSGKMRLNRIRVLIGDKVSLVLDPYGGKGRIMRRL